MACSTQNAGVKRSRKSPASTSPPGGRSPNSLSTAYNTRAPAPRLTLGRLGCSPRALWHLSFDQGITGLISTRHQRASDRMYLWRPRYSGLSGGQNEPAGQPPSATRCHPTIYNWNLTFPAVYKLKRTHELGWVCWLLLTATEIGLDLFPWRPNQHPYTRVTCFSLCGVPAPSVDRMGLLEPREAGTITAGGTWPRPQFDESTMFMSMRMISGDFGAGIAPPDPATLQFKHLPKILDCHLQSDQDITN